MEPGRRHLADGYDEEDEGEEEDVGGDEMDETEDEEYNLTNFGISQALPVPDGPPDFNAGPPQTAEEYLRWVRYEASKCPRVTRKDISPERLRRQQEQSDATAAAAAAAAAASGSGVGDGSAGTGGGKAGGGRRHAPQGFAGGVPPPVLSACQEWARPCNKWLRVFLQDFALLRASLGRMQRKHTEELAYTQLPPLDNGGAWDRLCFEQWEQLDSAQQAQHGEEQAGSGEQAEQAGQGQGEAAQAGTSGQGPEDTGAGARAGAQDAGQAPNDAGAGEPDRASSPSPPPPPPPPPPPEPLGGETDRLCGPVVRTVLALDQVSVGSLLQRHVSQLADQPHLTYMRSQWLFALAAVLERPVPPDVAAALRELVRRCSAWRASLSSPSDPCLPRLNLLLAVAGAYFGQDEGLAAAAAAAGLADLE
ncbi:hypothetical protein HYH03_012942 [Edaphochlamys debaryana]|uniref:Gem-associated protein 2 n=1 Tax=Edaphochlamys debaryana TaxID=47281 RepID=A0A835XX27_9CHLO|nr:hypothetical protein HYH03_012942 [Edaphochlamys debaryana]|eukprot:KAG2488435.1 hypothetical protein HYH03_012942 [Edaphochlamys debaryana]